MDPKQFTNLGRITTPFGAKTEQESFHPGVDIANKKGTPVKAAKGGVVVGAVSGKPHGSNDFGNSIMIKDEEGLTHRYSHLAKIGVRPGQKVPGGHPIATLGDSGATYAPNGGDSSNLDYRVVDAFGRFLNPVQYIDKL